MARIYKNQKTDDDGQKPVFHPQKSTYLFLSVFQGLCVATAITSGVHNMREAMTQFANMFPAHQQIGIMKCSLIEAGLLATNFNKKALMLIDYVRANMNVIGSGQPIFVNQMTEIGVPVYVVYNAYSIAPTMQKTDNFLGYITDAGYFNLVNKLFGYGWKPETINGDSK